MDAVEAMKANLARGPVLFDNDRSRVAIVTGAARGIGRACAENLLSRGWSVVVTDRDSASPGWIQGQPGAHYLECDVTDLSRLEEAVEYARSIGTLRACVANAGVIMEGYGGLTESTPEQWRKTFDVNVMGVLSAFRAVLPSLIEAGGGRLLATSSVSSIQAEPDLPVYSASKAAVSSIVKSLAWEYGRFGISVNALAPGPVETALQDEVIASRPATTPGGAMDRNRHAHRPLGRMAQPAEVGQMFGWLASDEAAYITGQTLVFDGGGALL